MQGKVTQWDQARGFGFIIASGQKDKIFLHISAITPRIAPKVGDEVNFTLLRENGKLRAADVRLVHAGLSSKQGKFRLGVPLLAAVLLGVTAYQVWVPHEQSAPLTLPKYDIPTHNVQTPASTNFSCDGRTHCSQMHSCAEAEFFLSHCANVKMDGDNDGRPCESQCRNGQWIE